MKMSHLNVPLTGGRKTRVSRYRGPVPHSRLDDLAEAQAEEKVRMRKERKNLEHEIAVMIGLLREGVRACGVERQHSRSSFRCQKAG